ncbi:MAG: acyl-CoA thioesterase [Waterburya sp.]
MKQQPFEVALDLPIKTYDIDFAGIVSNIVYIRWLEDLRLKMLEFYLPLEQLMSKGYCPTVNSTEIKYQKALRLGDRPSGRMWMSQLGRLRCTVQAEISLGQEIAATATQVGFFMSLETMRPMAIPEEIKHIYAEYN